MAQVQRIVINASFGGFFLTPVLMQRLEAQGVETPNKSPYGGYQFNQETNEFDYSFRKHPSLVALVEEFKDQEEVIGDLRVVDIPGDVEWELSNYDGWERIHEKHRSWG